MKAVIVIWCKMKPKHCSPGGTTKPTLTSGFFVFIPLAKLCIAQYAILVLIRSFI